MFTRLQGPVHTHHSVTHRLPGGGDNVVWLSDNGGSYIELVIYSVQGK